MITLASRQSESSGFTKSKGRISLNLVILFVLAIVLVFSMVQTNASIAQGYGMRESQQSLKKLEEENRLLNTEVLNIQSSQNLNEASAKINLIPVEKVLYLKDSPGGVVQR